MELGVDGLIWLKARSKSRSPLNSKVEALNFAIRGIFRHD
jgi:hypothetical protein